MKSFSQKYYIKAPVAKVWKALTNPKIIGDWGGGPVKMSARQGSSFSFWGGDIWGKNKKVVPQKLLVQEWYGGKWEEPSIVTFSLSEKMGNTALLLKHENLPDDSWKDFYEGWKDYYLGPLKKLVE